MAPPRCFDGFSLPTTSDICISMGDLQKQCDNHESKPLSNGENACAIDAGYESDSSPGTCSTLCEEDDSAEESCSSSSSVDFACRMQTPPAPATFCLAILLTHQVSISHSLAAASRTFVDANALDAVSQSARLATAAWRHAVTVVRNYRDVVQQIHTCVLPDVGLAVQECEPCLVACLMGTVMQWVDELKKGSDSMKKRYVQLQLMVQGARGVVQDSNSVDALICVHEHVEHILDRCSDSFSFWNHMREVTFELSQSLESAEGSQHRELRLVEYTSFWESLERMCVKYRDESEAEFREL